MGEKALQTDCPEERTIIGNAGKASSDRPNYKARILLLCSKFPLAENADLVDLTTTIDDRQQEMEIS